MSEEDIPVKKKKSEAPPPRRRPKKIFIPRRTPSVVVPEKHPIFITPDKLTCVECTCYPAEDPYIKNKKLNPCLVSPDTLYELAAKVVDNLKFPPAFEWSELDVARWMEEEVKLPQYKDSILNNHIDGLRLIMMENLSNLADINIRDFNHMKMITSKVRQLYSIEFLRFARSISLPPRKPLTHCTWFKSRTGPSWGVRKNWTRCDILRWMKIIMPESVKMDHWDLVWYQPPDFPKVKFARIEKRPFYQIQRIPHYQAQPEVCREYLTPRRFILQDNIRKSQQFIWMESVPSPKPVETKIKKVQAVKESSRLVPKKISLTGLTGKSFVLAKRKMPAPKFLP